MKKFEYFVNVLLDEDDDYETSIHTVVNEAQIKNLHDYTEIKRLHPKWDHDKILKKWVEQNWALEID